jgi:hypothetical protein
MSDPSPPIGHNSGDPDALPILRQAPDLETHLAAVYAPMLKRTKELLDKGPAKAKVFDDEADGNATEFLLAIRAEMDAVKVGKKDEKAPYDTLIEIIDGFFNTNVWEPLKALGLKVNEASTDYKVGVMRAAQITTDINVRAAQKIKDEAAKKAREDKEEADRLALAAARARKPENVERLTAAAEEARNTANVAQAGAIAVAVDHAEAVSEASTSAADLTRTHGKRVGVSSLRTAVKVLDLIDRKALTGGYNLLGPYFTDAAILAAARKYESANKATVGEHLDKGTQPIAGLTFAEDYSNVARKT